MELDADIVALQEFTYPASVALENRSPVTLTTLDSYSARWGRRGRRESRSASATRSSRGIRSWKCIASICRWSGASRAARWPQRSRWAGRSCTSWRRTSAFAFTSGGFRCGRSSNISTPLRNALFVVLGDFNDWLPGRSVVHVLDRSSRKAATTGVVSCAPSDRGSRSNMGASDGGTAARLHARDTDRATRVRSSTRRRRHRR